MTGDADEENLFRALTTSSTILLKIGLHALSVSLHRSSIVFQIGEMCKPYRRLDESPSEVADGEWTLSFEQLEAAMNAEASLVNWFESHNHHQSLEQRIHNYNQDFLR